ncbi:MAG TPA: sugar ABC transporter permease, partial [Microbacterium sp.]|nr:sugar ABC transporter permease [Microbacterium sp.]
IGALMWSFLYSPRFGPAATLFSVVGLEAPQFLAPDSIFGSLVNIVTWQWSGYYMIVIYAALRSIDPSIYEAARIDGAGGWQTATRIKIPMISSSMVMIIMFALIGTLQFFTEPVVLRNVAQGAIDASYTPNMYAYSLAFSYSQFNYASAIAFSLGILVFIGSFFFLFLTRKQSGLK